jgi:hypothetical protein
MSFYQRNGEQPRHSTKRLRPPHFVDRRSLNRSGFVRSPPTVGPPRRRRTAQRPQIHGHSLRSPTETTAIYAAARTTRTAAAARSTAARPAHSAPCSPPPGWNRIAPHPPTRAGCFTLHLPQPSPSPRQRRQGQPVPLAELLPAQPARLVLRNQALDLRPAPAAPSLSDPLFAHPSTSPSTPSRDQMSWSDAYPCWRLIWSVAVIAFEAQVLVLFGMELFGSTGRIILFPSKTF